MAHPCSFGCDKQRAIDHAARIGLAHIGLDLITLKDKTLVRLAQLNAFELAEFRADLLKLTVCGQFEVQDLTNL